MVLGAITLASLTRPSGSKLAVLRDEAARISKQKTDRRTTNPAVMCQDISASSCQGFVCIGKRSIVER